MSKQMILSDDQLEDFVVDLVAAADRYVLFHELIAVVALRFGFDVTGDAAISIDGNPNCVIWPLLEPALADAIIAAAKKQRIFYVPALPRHYRKDDIDFSAVGFAVADPENPPPNFDSPTWFPTVLSSKPLAENPPPWLGQDELDIVLGKSMGGMPSPSIPTMNP